jgi:hypothetical protein
MEEVAENLFVGAENACRSVTKDEDWSVVHACKHPCHNNQCGNPSQGHPNYLVYEDGSDIYLNMVDMDRKQDHQFMQPMISATLAFVENRVNSQQVLIHCNQGRSRSPTLAMMYLAKRADQISDESYSQASTEFQDLYPQFNPGQGIHLYLQDYWNQIE